MDGAMGTFLMGGGIRPEDCFDAQNLMKPDLVRSIHKKYVEAGADIIETNTFGANRLKLSDYDLSDKTKEINIAGTKLAKEAARDKAFVCGSIGPLGKFIKPFGELTFDEAYKVFAEQAQALEEGGADLVCIETISDLQEMRAAIIAVKENTKLIIISSMTYDENGLTIFGTPPEAHAVVAQALGADILSSNCSTGPKDMLEISKRFLQSTNLPVMAMANAGMPKLVEDKAVYKMTPDKFSSFALKFAELGVSIIGGCCGTTPEHIKAIRNRVGEIVSISPQVETTCVTRNYFASRTKVIEVEKGKLLKVGERINPTGKKLFKEELENGEMSRVKQEAQVQTRAQADLLDVNISIPDGNDKALMERAVDIASRHSPLPLCIDSPTTEGLEAGLKEFCGKALLNSVNGKDQSLKKVLPLAKKYGAAIIGLTFDEKGIPEKAEERIRVAENIINAARKAGIEDKDIFIDCLTMTLALGVEKGLEVLKAVKIVKEKFGVSTILGVGNSSHGLPNRSRITALFLRIAKLHGLDAAILDITSPEIRKAAFDTKNDQKEIEKLIKELKQEVDKAILLPKSAQKLESIQKKEYRKLSDIKEAVIEGDAETVENFTKLALDKNEDPQKIINESLIPGMQIVGDRFSSKEYFLPQVLSSAGAMSRGFKLCKARIPKENIETKGKVLIATVYGDVHDIGKNIVKMMLENHGFEVLDLGKDVHPDKIIEAAKKEKPSAIALSALLTSTMTEMRVVKAELKKAGLEVPVIIGGAVVNSEYAKKIGASYGQDAAQAVKLARQIITSAKK